MFPILPAVFNFVQLSLVHFILFFCAYIETILSDSDSIWFYIRRSLSKLMRVWQKITWMIKHCLCLFILSPPQSNISISCGLLNYIIWDINTFGAGVGQESKTCPSHRTWRQFWKGLRPAMELLFRCSSHTTPPKTSPLIYTKIIFTNILITNRNIPIIL